MGRYLGQRALLSALTLFLLALICFSLLHLLPGSPFNTELTTDQSVLRNLQEHYGLNLPFYQQIFLFSKNVLTFDFGPSLAFSGKSVWEVLQAGASVTFSIGFFALFLSLVMGLGLGFFLALSSRGESSSIVRHHILLITGFSLPTTLIGPSLLFLLSYHYPIFPLVVGESWKSLVLPVIVMSLRPMFTIARLFYSEYEIILKNHSTIMLKAQGLRWIRIVFLQSKMSIFPVLSYLPTLSASLLTGALVVEYLFNAQGLGMCFVHALEARDYNLVCALVLMFGTILVSTQLAVDFILAKLDPRINIFSAENQA